MMISELNRGDFDWITANRLLRAMYKLDIVSQKFYYEY